MLRILCRVAQSHLTGWSSLSSVLSVSVSDGPDRHTAHRAVFRLSVFHGAWCPHCLLSLPGGTNPYQYNATLLRQAGVTRVKSDNCNFNKLCKLLCEIFAVKKEHPILFEKVISIDCQLLLMEKFWNTNLELSFKSIFMNKAYIIKRRWDTNTTEDHKIQYCGYICCKNW